MNTLDLDTLTLAAGDHDPGDGEMCELVDRMLAVTEGDPA